MLFFLHRELDESAQNIRRGGKGELQLASIRKIVELITSKRLDAILVKAFIIGYAAVTHINHIMDLLLQRWNIPPPRGCSLAEFNQFLKTKLRLVRLRIVYFVRQWISIAPEDFRVQSEAREKLDMLIHTMQTQSWKKALLKLLLNADEEAKLESETITKVEQQETKQQSKSRSPILTVLSM